MSAAAPSTLEGTWALDKLHSTASFAVKHMVVSTFRTTFKDIDATFAANGDDDRPHGHRSGRVDRHRPARFPWPPDVRRVLRRRQHAEHRVPLDLRAARRPATPSQVDGELTVKGITQPVTATGTLTGPVADVMGNDRVGVELEAVVDRSLYDLNWNAPLPKGGEALGKKVTLAVHLEFIRQEA